MPEERAVIGLQQVQHPEGERYQGQQAQDLVPAFHMG